MRIAIKDVCGKNTVTRDDGRKVNKLIREAWEKPGPIIVDFGNVVIASVSFMDEAIGLLAADFSREELSSKLRLISITSEDKNLLNDILISRYKQRFLNRISSKNR